jgi:hypothetical protein
MGVEIYHGINFMSRRSHQRKQEILLQMSKLIFPIVLQVDEYMIPEPNNRIPWRVISNTALCKDSYAPS